MTMEKFLEKSLIDIELLFALMNGRVSSAINKRLAHDLKAAGLDITADQWSVLYSLWLNDGVTQKSIADSTFKDKPSITRLIDNLEAMGFVERRSDPSDRRINKVYLTESGIAVRENVRVVSLQTMQNVLQGLSEKEITQVQSLLKLIFKNLQKDKGEE